ncbi:hypothetical protein DPMN_141009 [Dreissena polymorpha]|uniref:Uncharacterized protein n=1 Tax=Dreissena polymorpha TaxID=45954 RepID=A0A9D4G8N5_DREPO|nr:hypothetical protein DPMN_141009 [Dreissena polymorpha]
MSKLTIVRSKVLFLITTNTNQSKAQVPYKHVWAYSPGSSRVKNRYDQWTFWIFLASTVFTPMTTWFPHRPNRTYKGNPNTSMQSTLRQNRLAQCRKAGIRIALDKLGLKRNLHGPAQTDTARINTAEIEIIHDFFPDRE